jgi:hypothetical protein
MARYSTPSAIGMPRVVAEGEPEILANVAHGGAPSLGHDGQRTGAVLCRRRIQRQDIVCAQKVTDVVGSHQRLVDVIDTCR